MRRVVVTGMGGITALGSDWPTVREHLSSGRTGVRRMETWERYEDIHTRLAAPINGFDFGATLTRKKLRTMGPVAQMAVCATRDALVDAGLLDEPVITNGRTGIAYGSSFGSPEPVAAFAELMKDGRSRNLNATSYIKMMSHTAAVNIGLNFSVTGRLIPTSSACTSGSQGIGFAFEAIRWNKADVMIAGGAEELDITETAVFDTLYATSVRNDQPDKTPRPFDRDRDGLVIGEGAATLILEEYQHALARRANIYAEIVGYATNTDGAHITQPLAETMTVALSLALEDANLPPEAIGFVNGQGTATETGDNAETSATNAVFGAKMPIHSLKSYFGHSLGACGSIEAWLGIEMMREGWFAHTANLDNVDDRCADLDYLIGEGRRIDIEYLMSNNFAFGGINTSLIFKRA